MRHLFMTIEKLTTNGIGIITFVTKLTCLRNIIPMMIVTILASSMLYAMPTTDDYLASIPSFVTERTDNSHGNYMVTGPGKVVIPISESGAEITDVIHYNDIRFYFDAEFNGLIKKLYFGDGSNSTAYSQTNFLDHQYNVAGSSETYSLTLKLYTIRGQHLYDIHFSITICPLLNNQSVSEIDDNVKLTYSMSNNTDAGRKPLLFIEGFALTGSTAAASIICMNPNFFSGLLNDGYDIFILTFGSSNQNSLTSNSQYVLAALDHIQTLYNQNEVLEPVKIIGYSMGGILARLALSYAEAGNYPHMSNALITLDSPHRGILINENAQNLLNDTMIQANLPDEFDEMIDAVFNSDAAKQMIRNNIAGINPSVEYGSNQYREVFGILNNSDSSGQNLLNNTGFPHQQNFVKKYAVALGSNTLSGNVNNSSNFSNINVRFKLGMLTSTHNIAGINSVWYDKTPSSLIPMRNKYTYTVYEHDWDDFLDQLLGTPKIQLIMSQSYIPPMVPTASSLCIESIPFTNGNYNSQLPTTFTTPFDGYYISPEPSYHNIIPQDASTWILNTLNAIENDPSSRMIGYATGSVTCQGNVSPGVNVSVTNITTNETYNTTTNELGEYSFPLFYQTACNYEVSITSNTCYPLTHTYTIAPNYLGNATIQSVSQTTVNLNSIIVYTGNPLCFQTINDALIKIIDLCSSGQNITEPIRIRVLPGTYTESVDLSPLAALGITNFTLEGVGEAIINGDGYGIKLVVNENSPSVGAVYNIKKLKIANSDRGILFKDYWDESSMNAQAPQLTLNISNCSIYDCGTSSHSGTGTDVFSAAAIHFEGAGSISYCNFLNNSIFADYGYTQYSQAGGVFIRNNTTSTSEVRCNTFTNNVGGLSGGLVATGTGPIRITKDNKFFGNTYRGYGSIANAHRANALSVYDASNIVINNNLFVNNIIPSSIPYGAVIGLTTYVSQAAMPIRFINNTIVNTPQYSNNGLSAIKFRINAGVDVQDIHIKNNIISSTNSNGCTIDSDAGYSPVSINYNILNNISLSGFNANLYNPTDPNSVYNPSAPLFNYQCDPELDANYYPKWNTNTKSPCIDNGDPDLNANGIPWYLDPEDQDSDGTRKDIGAYHNPAQHINGYHRLNNYEVKYISIPGVENHPGNQGRNTLQYVFDLHQGNNLLTMDPPILDRITWIYNSDTGEATPFDTPVHYVHSQNGYKVKLLFGETLEKDIVYSGFYPGYTLNPGMYHAELNDYTTKHFITAPDQLDGNCEIDPNTGVLFRETYLGYYLPESLKPFDALLPILDDIKAIMAEDWALVRVPIFGYEPQPGDPPSAYYTDLWLGSYLMNNENLAINHGEMVVVHYIGTNDVEFKLGGENPNPPFTEFYTRQMAKHFFFEEQLGYIPVFITMDLNQYEDGNKPTEIALFIDEVCKGAAVIKDGEIQLNAHITNSDDLSEDLKEVEFRLYFPAKSASSIVPEYAVLNLQTGVYESKTARVSDFKGFLSVQLNNTGEIPPPAATQLFQNYPNPFNPVTSIKYDLAETSQVRMDIYNVRGQHVKTLLNQEMLAGTHSVVWDGKDGQGNSVSSGVYFYRMTMPNKVLTNKMLLMK